MSAEAAVKERSDEGLGSLRNDMIMQILWIKVNSRDWQRERKATHLPSHRRLFITHRQRLIDRLSSPPRIPRIDGNTTPEPAITITPRELPKKGISMLSHKKKAQRNPTHFTENKRATPTLLALDKLVRPERHSLPQARHHECVRDAQ